MTIRSLPETLQVVTAGVEGFPVALRSQDVAVAEIDWRPPADGDPALVELLESLRCDPERSAAIDRANRQTLERVRRSEVRIIDVRSAAEALDLPGCTVLHSGPPIDWGRMCGPQRRAVLGAVRFEGWAEDEAGAERLVHSGEVQLAPCHRFGAVGPMTGVISPSMPVLVARNETYGNLAFSTFNEGRGNTLWFGVCDDETLGRLEWIRDVVAPAIRRGLGVSGPLPVFDFVAEGLQMGDECHARHAATTALLVKRFVPAMLEAGVAPDDVASIVRFADANGHFFLNFTMAAVKATMDAAHGVPASTVVTAMSRNGVDFMIRVGGLGDRWILAPVSAMDEAVYYTGFGVADAAGDIGDSAIIETCGLGGMAIAAAPSVAPFVGGSVADEASAVRELGLITLGRHEKFRLPLMDGETTPLGVDVRRVVETRIVPFITTGVLHETSPSTGQIGTGVARAPIAVFDDALAELARLAGVKTDGPSADSVVVIAPHRRRGEQASRSDGGS